MSQYNSSPPAQEAAEADVEDFRAQLGPFVVAAEKTRMAMLFTDGRDIRTVKMQGSKALSKHGMKSLKEVAELVAAAH